MLKKMIFLNSMSSFPIYFSFFMQYLYANSCKCGKIHLINITFSVQAFGSLCFIIFIAPHFTIHRILNLLIRRNIAMKFKRKRCFISHIIYNLKFKRKLFLICAISILFISSVFFLSFRNVTIEYSDMIYEQASYNLGFLSSQLFEKLDKVEDDSMIIATSDTIQSELQKYNSTYGVGKSIAYEKIQNFFSMYIKTENFRISLLTNDAIIPWGNFSNINLEDMREEITSLADAKNGSATWISSDKDTGHILCIRKIREKEYISLENLGYLIIEVDLDAVIADIAVYLNQHEYILSIEDTYGEVIYITPQYEKAEISLANTVNETYSMSTINNILMLQTKQPLLKGDTDWFVTFAIPCQEIYDTIRNSQFIYIVAIILAIILSLFLSIVSMKNISKRFDYLVLKMERLKTGNFELLVASSKLGNDELGLLNKYFDEMTVNFKQIIEDNYIKELLITQAKLKSLEQQINPHFLYNTLDSIKCASKIYDEEKVSIMIESLARLLRYSLSIKEDSINLKDELDIANSYIEIQKIRFSDILQVDFEIDERLFQNKIPKMTIQPLVENVIIHAMENTIDECFIKISAFSTEANVIISVQNSGSQIDENIIALINENKITPKGSGIGLNNIDSRIKILFGIDYGLSFKNDNKNVIVEIKLPKTYE